jgi:outer membrane protein assembly factor BamB
MRRLYECPESKMMRSKIPVILSFILFFILNGCTQKPGIVWRTILRDIDSFSSARTVDLNRDGVLDIVIGAGAKENYHSDSAVIAMDGKDGKILWMVPGRNQYVGSAIFKDITHDNVPDVFIGGRWAEFKAIDGSNGKKIWEFLPNRIHENPADSGWYNFTSAQFIPDQDNDGVEDILVANGGDAMASPTKTERPAGRLVIISSMNGKVLSYAVVPDGKETYMSPVCVDINRDGDLDIFFGTGGETISGHLYRTTLKNVMSGGILKADVLLASEKKGFVAPPVLVDITLDGVLDIVVSVADGKLVAINGASSALLWEANMPRTEIFNSPGVGFFTNDSIPDFFANFGRGTYPSYDMQFQILLDGSDGKILFRDSIGEFQYASPVTMDTNHDGYDEVLLNLTTQNIYIGPFAHLLLIDFHNNQKLAVGDSVRSMNCTASTPWIGDLNGDDYLDIIYSGSKIYEHNNSPGAMAVTRYTTNIKASRNPAWGAYMGKNYNGIFSREKQN